MTRSIPKCYRAVIIHGFVEELVVNEDPEYQWIDRIRTPRASNEARQRLISLMSGIWKIIIITSWLIDLILENSSLPFDILLKLYNEDWIVTDCFPILGPILLNTCALLSYNKKKSESEAYGSFFLGGERKLRLWSGIEGSSFPPLSVYLYSELRWSLWGFLFACVLSYFSGVWLFASPWAAAHQTSLSIALSWQE